MAELSNEELFNSALSDDPLVVTEEVAGGEDQGGTLIRDEATGRFVAKTEEPEPKPGVTQEVKPAIVAEPAAESPGVRQLREALERSDRRASEFERQLVALRPKPEAPVKPDIFEKPDEFVRSNVQEAVAPIEQKFSSFIESVSRRDAVREHGQDRVTEAFSALDQAAKSGDPQAQAVVLAVKQSMDPFGDIVSWYAGNEASRNPEGFFQRKLEEALKDEKFKGELLTKLQPAAEEKPASVFQIPPKLGRAASAASALAEGGDLSNESLFEHSMR